ncbi:hypothetical protein [Chthonobacter rhizosphaerae]|uniref:hypothetical protein n=1 Tax=Chthonobacter rhizosphaerae TaxID=2735553 RepID=UPI0015EFAD83|nr:hypothetical protein [Chthonobacter rhizosphaerae]
MATSVLPVMAAGLSADEIKSSFIDKPFTWTHTSGVGGSTIHKADGSMVYDLNGKTRTAKWAIKKGKFCINAGDSDEACFALVANGKVFKSEDGKLVYTPK